MFCAECGSGLEPGGSFCANCGMKSSTVTSDTVSTHKKSSWLITILSLGALGLLIIFAAYFRGLIQGPWNPGEVMETSAVASKLTDRDIKSLLETEWNGVSNTVPVPLGNFAVLGGLLGSPNVDASKGTISSDTYKYLIAWQKVGLVTVRHDQQYENFRSGRNFSWDQFAELTQKNVQTKIAVTPTEHGRQYLKSGSMDKLEIPPGKFRITKIMKNEEHKKGVNEYRLIMATYDAEWSPEYKAFSELMGNKIDQKRKVINLRKFDPFESKWKHYAEDDANANEEFKSDNVARALASAQ